MGHDDDGLYGGFDSHDEMADHDEYAADLSPADDHLDPVDGGHDEFTPGYEDHVPVDGSYDDGSDPYVDAPAGHDEFTPADVTVGDDGHDDLVGYHDDDTATPIGALTDMPYDLDDGTSGFPPALDLGIDAPADGGPWLDLSLLGDGSDVDDDASGAHAYAAEIPDSPPGGLVDLASVDAAGDGTNWTELAQSDDLAVHSLATLWAPAA